VPTEVTYYKCNICLKVHEVREDASDCEALGWPVYAFEVGQLIEELGCTVHAQLAVRYGEVHKPAYHLVGSFTYFYSKVDPTKASEASIFSMIKWRRRCSICQKKHSTFAQTKICEAQGYPTYRWEKGTKFPETGIEILDLMVENEKGKHVPVYRIGLPNHHIRYITEDDMSQYIVLI